MDPHLVERIRRMYEADSVAEGLPTFLELGHPDIELVLARDWVDMESVFRGRDQARALRAVS